MEDDLEFAQGTKPSVITKMPEINCHLTRVHCGVGRCWEEQGLRNSARVAEWQEKAKGACADERSVGSL